MVALRPCPPQETTENPGNPPLKKRVTIWVIESLEHLFAASPFPLRAIHSDSGSEFLNAALVRWCESHGVPFTRAEPAGKTIITGSNKKTTLP
jgi:hypothetical protein